MFSSIATDSLLKQSFERKDTAAASRRMRELREKESSYRTLTQTDKVTQWLARNDNDKSDDSANQVGKICIQWKIHGYVHPV